MELFVSSSVLSVSKFRGVCLPAGSRVGDLVQQLLTDHGFPSEDFYVTTSGRVCGPAEPLLQGSAYRLEARLCGGKGGFGSMLRALGAQIEKTTNREACRDLSGRRLRDVNHEKEMAEWLKKQAELEGQKDQRRVERLQRKLVEPKHQFTDTDYQRQCHDLSERLEDSVLKGMQASSSVSVEAGTSTKRANQHPDPVPRKKKCFWTGVGDLDLLDSEEEEGPGPSHQTRPAEEPASTGSDQPEPLTQKHQDPQQADPQQADPQQTDPQQADPQQTDPQQVCTPVDLDSAGSPEDLEVLGLDRLKEELVTRGLKCGGTLKERAARLYSVRGLRPEQIDRLLLANTSTKGKKRK